MKEDLNTALNGICPYFTMFPLSFPYSILRRRAEPGEIVADPFCGRGTTSYACRLLGLQTVAIDSNPVAVALSMAKLVATTPPKIARAASNILDSHRHAKAVPSDEFWTWAFDARNLCRLREGLLEDCHSASRIALRAIL